MGKETTSKNEKADEDISQDYRAWLLAMRESLGQDIVVTFMVTKKQAFPVSLIGKKWYSGEDYNDTQGDETDIAVKKVTAEPIRYIV